MRSIVLLLSAILASPLQAAYITDKLVAGLYEDAAVSDKPLKALPSGTPLEVISRKNGFVKVRTPDGTDGWVEATYLTDEKPARTMLLDTQAKLSILQKQLEQAKGQLANATGGGSAAAPAAQGEDLQDKLAQARGQASQLELQLKAARLELDNARQQLQQAQQQHEKQLAEQQAAANQATQQLSTENEQLHERIGKVAELLQITPPPAAAAVAAGPAEAPLETSGGLLQEWKNSYWIWLAPLLTLLAGFIAGIAFIDYRIRKRFGGFRF